MTPIEFKRVVTTFCDPNTDFLFENQSFLIQVNDEVLTYGYKIVSNEVIVIDNEMEFPARKWITNVLARLDILSNRITTIIETNNTYIYPDLKSDLESDDVQEISNDSFLSQLRARSTFSTGVVYLTSDAGEGKTSFVNQLAVYQAKKFRERESEFLVVPIQLGGRTFHRFDDIVMGALANRLRFPFLSYQSFIELIKQGIIIPALDGFEEMLVENSTGEALSAMGTLLNDLNSAGSLIVSARKAYYEFENLKAQPKLFDIIRGLDVTFYKIEIARWDKDKFINYLNKIEISQADSIYNQIITVISPDHAILTRPVLVKKLAELLKEIPIDQFIKKIRESGTDLINSLIDTIIEREADFKWLESSGIDEVYKPLIPKEDHYGLLANLSIEMWQQKKDFLNEDLVNVVVDLYGEHKKYNSNVLRQVKTRIKGHALLIASASDQKSIEFDHAEFKDFFLAKGIAELINDFNKEGIAKTEVVSIYRKEILPESVITFLPTFLNNHQLNENDFIKYIHLAYIDGLSSYLHTNISSTLLRLIPKVCTNEILVIKKISFNLNALMLCNLENLLFEHCNFAATKLTSTFFNKITFKNCEFDVLVFEKSTTLNNVIFEDSSFSCIEVEGSKLFDPVQINNFLRSKGFLNSPNVEILTQYQIDYDDEILCLEKLLRYFLRSTHVSESVMRMKVGANSANNFIDNIVPDLVKSKILVEVKNEGKGTQKRYRLGYDMKDIENNIKKSKGKFDIFISFFDNTL